MDSAENEPWTVERFLTWEDQQEGKHEFDGIRVIPLDAPTRTHQRIIVNLLRALEEELDPARFDAVQEMRVVVGGKVRYADISVCAGAIPDTAKTLQGAVVIIDVMSDEAPENTDQAEKRLDYARLPGIRTYVLVEQTHMATTVLARNADGWTETKVTIGSIALPDIGIALPLSAVYRGVSF